MLGRCQKVSAKTYVGELYSCIVTGYSNKKIRSLLHISRYTVGKVLTMYRKWGCVNNPFVGPRGRRKLFDATDMEVCIVANRLNSLY